MKKWILPVLLIGVFLGGCVGLSAESSARIEALRAENARQLALLAELQKKVESGDATAADAMKAAAIIQAAVDMNKAEIKAIADNEGGTTRDMLLVGAGVFGRTVLHGAARVLPTLPLGSLGGVINALLGLILQSESKKKEGKA